MSYKFGKLPPITDTRTLKMTKYAIKFPPTPPAVDYLTKVPSYPMYSNDTLGDCVAAAAGHMIESWTEYAGKFYEPTDADIIAFYEFSGYVPSDPATDQGWELVPALNAWRQQGIAGHKIVAYAQLETGDYAQLKQAIAIFGNAYVGLNLPDYVVPSDGPDWTTIPWFYSGNNNPPNPSNGHCIPIMKYSDQKRRAWFVSWAAEMVMNPPFYTAYSDEAYVAITRDWIEADQKSPSGFDITQLLADLDSVANWTRAGWEKRTGKTIQAPK
jgi:hypothetical protein